MKSSDILIAKLKDSKEFRGLLLRRDIEESEQQCDTLPESRSQNKGFIKNKRKKKKKKET